MLPQRPPGSKCPFRSGMCTLVHSCAYSCRHSNVSDHHLDGGAGSTSWAVLDILVAVVTLHGLIAPWMTGLIIQAIGKNVSQSHSLHFTLLANQVLASSTRSRFGMHHS